MEQSRYVDTPDEHDVRTPGAWDEPAEPDVTQIPSMPAVGMGLLGVGLALVAVMVVASPVGLF